MNPSIIINSFLKRDGFKRFLKEIELAVNRNILSDYKLWGDKVFIPFEIYNGLIKKCFDLEKIDPKEIYFARSSIVWNYCRSKYVFEDKLFKQIIESKKNNIPIKTFLFLKEWAIYLDLRKHNLTALGIKMDGALLCLSNYGKSKIDNKYSEEHLLLCIDIFNYEKGSFRTTRFTLPIENDDIEKSVDLAIYLKNCSEKGKWLGSDDEDDFEHISDFEKKEKVEINSNILNLALFILCQNSRLENKNDKNLPFTPTKKVKKVFSPRDIKTWIVKAEHKTFGEMDINKSSNIMMPHVRRGHFHSYWIGPRDNPKDIVVKWIPPIYVNAHKIKRKYV